jgi:anti-sigma factor ChrR (cupin superfamily)
MAEREGRRVVATAAAAFGPYDLEGPVQADIALLPLTLDRACGRGAYMMRMQPGAVTIAHTHALREEFLVMAGDLVDDDGTVFGPGDFIAYAPGTRHGSRTEGGCLILVVEY